MRSSIKSNNRRCFLKALTPRIKSIGKPSRFTSIITARNGASRTAPKPISGISIVGAVSILPFNPTIDCFPTFGSPNLIDTRGETKLMCAPVSIKAEYRVFSMRMPTIGTPRFSKGNQFLAIKLPMLRRDSRRLPNQQGKRVLALHTP